MRRCLSCLGMLAGATLLLPGAASAQTCAAPDAAAGGPSNAHTAKIESGLLPAIIEDDDRPHSLAERMKLYRVPGVSVAVIHNGRIDWARGWGVRDLVSCKPVTPETVFQAASISKTVTALTALRLVEQKKLALDGDINAGLTSWKLPKDATFAPGFVTLRQLLSHTAGTNIHGFPGYEIGTPVPTPLQILKGEPPAPPEPVKLEAAPGKQWRYSGGGYQIVQVALEDVSHLPFAELARREVLAPLGMTRSSYAQPPSAEMLRDAATSGVNGKPIAGGYHLYPEQAAAGLWTTPSDLARLLLAMQASAAGRSSALLPQARTQEMLTEVMGHWGLGFTVLGSGAERRFGHDGSNEGYQSTMVAYVERGEGVIVLTNSDQGIRLAGEVVRAVANDYGWRDLAPQRLSDAQVPPGTAEALVGYYSTGPVATDITMRGGKLYASVGGPLPERLVLVSPTRVRTAGGISADVERDAAGKVTGLKVVDGGPPVTLVRGEPPAGGIPAAPLYLRGSMNDWSTASPLTRHADGSFSIELPLAAGDYEFKLAAENWAVLDLGADDAVPIEGTISGRPLFARGSNIPLKVIEAGTYRFTLKPGGTRPLLDVARVR